MVVASFVICASLNSKTSSVHESYPWSSKALAYRCRLSDASTAAIASEPSAGGAAPMEEEVLSTALRADAGVIL